MSQAATRWPEVNDGELQDEFPREEAKRMPSDPADVGNEDLEREARWEQARRRLREAFTPEQLEGMLATAMQAEPQTDDELLLRAWKGEFGEQAFYELYGEDATKLIKTRRRA